MPKLLGILLVALMIESAGVVLLSRGLKQIGGVARVTPGELSRLIGKGLLNSNIQLGVLLEAIFFGAFLYLLSQKDVSLIWPLTALGFVITALSARFILNEEVTWVRWSGVLLIAVGAAIVSYSDIQKNPASDSPGERPLERLSSEIER